MRAQLGLAIPAFVLAGAFAAAHEDVVEGPHGVTRVEDRLQAQGQSRSQDRAYAWWAQYEDECAPVLDFPRGKRSITVAEAVRFAKKTWKVNILDETDDPAVGKIRFAMGMGCVEREMALPLFLESLALAVSGARQDCYVEQDDRTCFMGRLRDYHKNTVHIRRARPLQADYDHPWDVDRAEIEKLDEAMKAEEKPAAPPPAQPKKEVAKPAPAPAAPEKK